VGEVRPREPSARPQHGQSVRADIGQAEAAQVDQGDSACQGLRGQTHKVWGRTPQYEKATRSWILVGKHAQDREQIASSLSLVDNDRALECGQTQGRLTQPSSIAGILEVEEIRLGWLNDRPGERGFPGLTGAREEDDRRPPQRSSEPLLVLGTENYPTSHHPVFLA
jgi:hypothetical protein